METKQPTDTLHEISRPIPVKQQLAKQEPIENAMDTQCSFTTFNNCRIELPKVHQNVLSVVPKMHANLGLRTMGYVELVRCIAATCT